MALKLASNFANNFSKSVTLALFNSASILILDNNSIILLIYRFSLFDSSLLFSLANNQVVTSSFEYNLFFIANYKSRLSIVYSLLTSIALYKVPALNDGNEAEIPLV
jgi:hypothetical protein